MTSMPASRRARAMTLAPRSWPSRPGLAISTRILFSGILFCVPLQAKVKSGDGDFFVGAESVAHGVADFAERGVRFYGGVDRWHEIVCSLRRLAKMRERAIHLVLGAFGAELFEALALAMRHGFVNLQDLG